MAIGRSSHLSAHAKMNDMHTGQSRTKTSGRPSLCHSMRKSVHIPVKIHYSKEKTKEVDLRIENNRRDNLPETVRKFCKKLDLTFDFEENYWVLYLVVKNTVYLLQSFGEIKEILSNAGFNHQDSNVSEIVSKNALDASQQCDASHQCDDSDHHPPVSFHLATLSAVVSGLLFSFEKVGEKQNDIKQRADEKFGVTSGVSSILEKKKSLDRNLNTILEGSEETDSLSHRSSGDTLDSTTSHHHSDRDYSLPLDDVYIREKKEMSILGSMRYNASISDYFASEIVLQDGFKVLLKKLFEKRSSDESDSHSDSHFVTYQTAIIQTLCSLLSSNTTFACVEFFWKNFSDGSNFSLKNFTDVLARCLISTANNCVSAIHLGLFLLRHDGTTIQAQDDKQKSDDSKAVDSIIKQKIEDSRATDSQENLYSTSAKFKAYILRSCEKFGVFDLLSKKVDASDAVLTGDEVYCFAFLTAVGYYTKNKKGLDVINNNLNNSTITIEKNPTTAHVNVLLVNALFRSALKNVSSDVGSYDCDYYDSSRHLWSKNVSSTVSSIDTNVDNTLQTSTLHAKVATLEEKVLPEIDLKSKKLEKRCNSLEFRVQSLQQELRRIQNASLLLFQLRDKKHFPGQIDEHLWSILKSGWESLQYDKGYNLLHLAAESLDVGQIEVNHRVLLELLCTLATDIDSRDSENRRPIDYARRAKKIENASCIKRMRCMLDTKNGVRSFFKSGGGGVSNKKSMLISTTTGVIKQLSPTATTTTKPSITSTATTKSTDPKSTPDLKKKIAHGQSTLQVPGNSEINSSVKIISSISTQQELVLTPLKTPAKEKENSSKDSSTTSSSTETSSITDRKKEVTEHHTTPEKIRSQNSMGSAVLNARLNQLDEMRNCPKKLKRVLKAVEETGWANIEWPSMFTAFHLSAQLGHAEAVEFLLGCPGVADIAEEILSLKDDRNRTPYDYAIKFHSQNINLHELLYVSTTSNNSNGKNYGKGNNMKFDIGEVKNRCQRVRLQQSVNLESLTANAVVTTAIANLNATKNISSNASIDISSKAAAIGNLEDLSATIGNVNVSMGGSAAAMVSGPGNESSGTLGLLPVKTPSGLKNIAEQTRHKPSGNSCPSPTQPPPQRKPLMGRGRTTDVDILPTQNSPGKIPITHDISSRNVLSSRKESPLVGSPTGSPTSPLDSPPIAALPLSRSMGSIKMEIDCKMKDIGRPPKRRPSTGVRRDSEASSGSERRSTIDGSRETVLPIAIHMAQVQSDAIPITIIPASGVTAVQPGGIGTTGTDGKGRGSSEKGTIPGSSSSSVPGKGVAPPSVAGKGNTQGEVGKGDTQGEAGKGDIQEDTPAKVNRNPAKGSPPSVPGAGKGGPLPGGKGAPNIAGKKGAPLPGGKTVAPGGKGAPAPGKGAVPPAKGKDKGKGVPGNKCGGKKGGMMKMKAPKVQMKPLWWSKYAFPYKDNRLAIAAMNQEKNEERNQQRMFCIWNGIIRAPVEEHAEEAPFLYLRSGNLIEEFQRKFAKLNVKTVVDSSNGEIGKKAGGKPKNQKKKEKLRVITDTQIIVGKEAALKSCPSAVVTRDAILDLDDTIISEEQLHLLVQHALPCDTTQLLMVEQLVKQVKEDKIRIEKELEEGEKEGGEKQDDKNKPEVEWSEASYLEAALGLPEYFMYMLSRIPAFDSRLRAWLYSRTYYDSVKLYSVKLDVLESMFAACLKSTQLPRLLEIFLEFGNFLNLGNQQRGGADGYDVIDLFQKLETVKDNLDSSKDLRHFLFQYIAGWEKDSSIPPPTTPRIVVDDDSGSTTTRVLESIPTPSRLSKKEPVVEKLEIIPKLEILPKFNLPIFLKEFMPVFKNVHRRCQKNSDGAERVVKKLSSLEDFDPLIREFIADFQRSQDISFRDTLASVSDLSDPVHTSLKESFTSCQKHISELNAKLKSVKDKFSAVQLYFSNAIHADTISPNSNANIIINEKENKIPQQATTNVTFSSTELFLAIDNLLFPESLILKGGNAIRKRAMAPIMTAGKEIKPESVKILWEVVEDPEEKHKEEEITLIGACSSGRRRSTGGGGIAPSPNPEIKRISGRRSSLTVESEKLLRLSRKDSPKTVMEDVKKEEIKKKVAIPKEEVKHVAEKKNFEKDSRGDDERAERFYKREEDRKKDKSERNEKDRRERNEKDKRENVDKERVSSSSFGTTDSSSVSKSSSSFMNESRSESKSSKPWKKLEIGGLSIPKVEEIEENKSRSLSSTSGSKPSCSSFTSRDKVPSTPTKKFSSPVEKASLKTPPPCSDRKETRGSAEKLKHTPQRTSRGLVDRFMTRLEEDSNRGKEDLVTNMKSRRDMMREALEKR